MNQRYKIWTPQGRIPDKFIVLEEPKEKQSLTFSDFYSINSFELIRDSSLWCSNFIPLVHDSIIIIGSRSVTYTFGSRFTYKRWVRVLSKIWILAFLGKYSNIDCWVSKCVNWGSHHILILFVGSQCVSIEVRITKY